MKRVTMFLEAGILLLYSMLYATVPQLINFQGILKDGSGNPVANGNYSVTFAIYDAPVGGTNLWTETQSVTTTNGLFNVLLGSTNPVPDSAFNNISRYLGVKVGADPEMTPRQKLTSVGYTFRTEQWTSAGQNLFRLNGNVGIGTNIPYTFLHIRKDAVGTLGPSFTLMNGAGLAGAGASIDFDGYDPGGANPPSARIQSLDDGNYSSHLTFSTKTPGANSNALVERVRISNEGSVGIGVTAPVAWLDVDVRSPEHNTGILGTGLNTGVAGSGATAFGLYGESTEGWAGWFQGSVNVTGTLFKGSGGFKIDDPADPANKYLYHSFVESPDMKNIYDGVVVTDSKGKATVTLPKWFGALNKDFRYQLTVIGEFAQAIISKEVANNQFSIQTDKPSVKVCWQVTGIRQDAYANAHRIPVEELKSDKERGYYLHPELFGQPEEKSVEWAIHPEMMKEMKARKFQAEKEQK